jgi:hypothetical protein
VQRSLRERGTTGLVDDPLPAEVKAAVRGAERRTVTRQGWQLISTNLPRRRPIPHARTASVGPGALAEVIAEHAGADRRAWNLIPAWHLAAGQPESRWRLVDADQPDDLEPGR